MIDLRNLKHYDTIPAVYLCKKLRGRNVPGVGADAAERYIRRFGGRMMHINIEGEITHRYALVTSHKVYNLFY